MFTNYIKKSLELNKLELDQEDGLNLYYDKVKNLSSVLFYGLVFSLVFTWMAYKVDDNPTMLILILAALILGYALQEAIGRLILKTPVFILKGSKLYYVKTKQWYDIVDHRFEHEHIGKINLFLTYCMYDKKGKRIFAEKHWYFNGSLDFTKRIWYNRAMKLKEKAFSE